MCPSRQPGTDTLPGRGADILALSFVRPVTDHSRNGPCFLLSNAQMSANASDRWLGLTLLDRDPYLGCEFVHLPLGVSRVTSATRTLPRLRDIRRYGRQ